MPDYSNQANAQNALTGSSPKGSRINADVESLLRMVKRVHEARERIQRHTSALGYHADTPPTEGSKVSPIASTLSNALTDLDHALEQLSVSLNLFD